MTSSSLLKVKIYAGPTASGKSAAAHGFAQSHDGIILNGDSLQVYQGLEILTAQPSLQEQKEIPHHLYGFLDPATSCSVGRWLPLVLAEIEKAHASGQVPCVVGGTGLYLKALREGLSPLPSIPLQIREDLQREGRPLAALYADLQRVDPALALRLNPHDQQRILRGLEVFYGTGTALSVWQAQPASPPAYDFEIVLFNPLVEALEKCMAQRLETMILQGVVEEIAHARARSLSVNAQKAIGFMEFSAYIEGKCSLQDAKNFTLLHTRQYAKRQRTWFRRFL